MCGVGNLTRAAYATLRMTLEVKSPISKKQSGVRRLRYVVNPRGVSSHHVLFRAFGDAYFRRENVRHATLLFRARECRFDSAEQRTED